MVRHICTIWFRSCTVQVASNWTRVTSPNSGWKPVMDNSSEVSCLDSKIPTFLLRISANSCKSCRIVFPVLFRNCAKRSKGGNDLSRLSERMISMRGIQSVFSAWIRCPTTSKGLQVFSPSFWAVQSSLSPPRSDWRTCGVREIISIDLLTLNSI